MGPTSVGRALRSRRRFAIGGGVSRWVDHGVWRPSGRRMYQRPRHQRCAAALGELVDRARLLLRQRSRHGNAAVSPVRNPPMAAKPDKSAQTAIAPVLVITAQDRRQEKKDAPDKPDSPRQLVLGFVFGIVFGFLLQKGGVAKYEVLLGQFFLTDFTVMKIMLTAHTVGMVGIFSMRALGLVKLHVKPTRYASNIVGGLLFGVGMGLLGYCPGTGAAALGQGNYDAIAGLGGLMAGRFFF